MVRSESVRKEKTSTRAAPKLGSNGGWQERSQRQSWRFQERSEKTEFLHCGLEKAELGTERNFMERLRAIWKKGHKAGPREVSGGLGTQICQLLKTGKQGRRRSRTGSQEHSTGTQQRT